ELGPEHILRRVSPTEIRSLAALYRFLEPGELLHGVPAHAVFRAFCADADPRSFGPPKRLAALRASKSRSAGAADPACPPRATPHRPPPAPVGCPCTGSRGASWRAAECSGRPESRRMAR